MEVLVKQTDGSYKFQNIDSAVGNLRTVAYTIGVHGVADCDYNFASVANTTEQSIQLGATTIIPANSIVIIMIAKCTDGLNGVITGTGDIGTTSGGIEYMDSANIDDTNDITSSLTSPLAVIFASASSVWFSFTPSANWNTITNGKWKIWISFIDNSSL